MRVGVDVGGTNTDAVLMNGADVVAAYKTPTTANISDGIVAAVREVLKQARIEAGNVRAVMIGTTHFTNALVERRELAKVGAIRIALPASAGVRPFAGWPPPLREQICGDVHLIGGGYHVNGRISEPLDERALRGAARSLHAAGIDAIAISGMFTPVNDDMERRAKQIVQDEIPNASISCSGDIGSLGLLERENAAIMNASLRRLASKVISSFGQALKTLDIQAPLFISQNDGTLMAAERAELYPVFTFASGPTNSMRGAAYLSGATNALVADIGGTTTDIGMLVDGFPRESSMEVDIGGVRTNFRMPDILAIGLGGGSHVSLHKDEVTIGPQSVGYRLMEQALVFGGEQLTASDIAVAAGLVEMGEPANVTHLRQTDASRAADRIREMIGDGVDRMKTSADDVPLILVGGGAVIVSGAIAGTSEVIVPDHASVANAVGASIAQVGGEVDSVFSYEALGREAAMEQACDEARRAAIAAGADESSISIVSIDEVPLAYVPGGSVRLRVKAAGNLVIQ